MMQLVDVCAGHVGDLAAAKSRPDEPINHPPVARDAARLLAGTCVLGKVAHAQLGDCRRLLRGITAFAESPPFSTSARICRACLRVSSAVSRACPPMVIRFERPCALRYWTM
jgi:hypothetical protein